MNFFRKCNSWSDNLSYKQSDAIHAEKLYYIVIMCCIVIIITRLSCRLRVVYFLVKIFNASLPAKSYFPAAYHSDYRWLSVWLKLLLTSGPSNKFILSWTSTFFVRRRFPCTKTPRFISFSANEERKLRNSHLFLYCC